MTRVWLGPDDGHSATRAGEWSLYHLRVHNFRVVSLAPMSDTWQAQELFVNKLSDSWDRRTLRSKVGARQYEHC